MTLWEKRRGHTKLSFQREQKSKLLIVVFWKIFAKHGNTTTSWNPDQLGFGEKIADVKSVGFVMAETNCTSATFHRQRSQARKLGSGQTKGLWKKAYPARTLRLLPIRR